MIGFRAEFLFGTGLLLLLAWVLLGRKADSEHDEPWRRRARGLLPYAILILLLLAIGHWAFLG